MQLVSQGGFEGLAAIAKLLLTHKGIELLQQVGVNRQGDLCFRHGGRMKYPTTWADIGDPIANITLIDDPATRFLVIMKDGRIHKNLRQ